MVLLRTKAASVAFIEVVEAANIAFVVVTVRCLGSAEFEELSGGGGAKRTIGPMPLSTSLALSLCLAEAIMYDDIDRSIPPVDQ
jgi:hypothetical protein